VGQRNVGAVQHDPTWTKLLFNLFIFGLLNDADSSSDFRASNTKDDECKNKMNVEGSYHGLI
jgi:hypothetical protein